MPFRKQAIIEIDENAKLSEIPDVGVWEIGTLDTNPRTFDLLCTGKVQINSTDYKLKLDISAAEKIPDFFTKNSAGEVVFAEPKPMCTIKMPKGHNGTIVVRLKSVSTEQTLAEDYVCLGVRENDDITDVLYGDDGYKYIDMTDDSKVELVPLISTTKLPGYTEAEVGAKVSFSDTNFDFGTVYRITIDDEQVLEKDTLTQTEGKSLYDISNNERWYNYSNGAGVGPVNGKGVRMLAVNTNGKLASSNDGVNWEDEGTISTGSGWYTGPVYGNGTWCAVSNSGAVRYSQDETRTWLTGTTPLGSGYSLAFGNGVFMSIRSDKKVYASIDANTWEEIGYIPYDADVGDTSSFGGIYILLYDSNDSKWMCTTFTGYEYASSDGYGEWKYVGAGINSIHGGGFAFACYAHGGRYVHSWSATYLIKSVNGKEWGYENSDNIGGMDSLSFYNGKIYGIYENGKMCYIFTFK